MSNDILLASKVREKAAWYICQWIGTPGGWGGDDFSAYDCNGAVHEALQGVGLEPRGFDCTAHDLYLRHPIESHVPEGYAGCLVFWFSGRKAIHVEMMIDKDFVVGASGVSRKTITREDAIRDNAYVKMNALGYRGNNFKIIDPTKGKLG